VVLPLENGSTMGTAATGPHGCLAVLDTCMVGPGWLKPAGGGSQVCWRHQLQQSERGARRGRPTRRGPGRLDHPRTVGACGSRHAVLCSL
jgi:hypothetical protein